MSCLNDFEIFENSQPSAMNFKSFSRSLEQFFLTVGQNNFGNKIPFPSIFFQNTTIKLWMWPLTKDLILKDPISFSKSTKKAWKKDFLFRFWPWPSTCQLMLKDFAGAEITDKPDITPNFSYGKRKRCNEIENSWDILRIYVFIVTFVPKFTQPWNG